MTNSGATETILGKHPESLLSPVPGMCQVVIEVQNQDATLMSKLRPNTALKDSIRFYQLLPQRINVGDMAWIRGANLALPNSQSFSPSLSMSACWSSSMEPHVFLHWMNPVGFAQQLYPMMTKRA